MIIVKIDPVELQDLCRRTSIVWDARGELMDEVLENLCIDIDNGRVQIRWGEGFGDHFVPWRPPFGPISFVVFEREYLFCMEGQEEQTARRVDVD